AGTLAPAAQAEAAAARGVPEVVGPHVADRAQRVRAGGKLGAPGRRRRIHGARQERQNAKRPGLGERELLGQLGVRVVLGPLDGRALRDGFGVALAELPGVPASGIGLAFSRAAVARRGFWPLLLLLQALPLGGGGEKLLDRVQAIGVRRLVVQEPERGG